MFFLLNCDALIHQVFRANVDKLKNYVILLLMWISVARLLINNIGRINRSS